MYSSMEVVCVWGGGSECLGLDSPGSQGTGEVEWGGWGAQDDVLQFSKLEHLPKGGN